MKVTTCRQDVLCTCIQNEVKLTIYDNLYEVYMYILQSQTDYLDVNYIGIFVQSHLWLLINRSTKPLPMQTIYN